jgi:hypothetical protein
MLAGGARAEILDNFDPVDMVREGGAWHLK